MWNSHNEWCLPRHHNEGRVCLRWGVISSALPSRFSSLNVSSCSTANTFSMFVCVPSEDLVRKQSDSAVKQNQTLGLWRSLHVFLWGCGPETTFYLSWSSSGPWLDARLKRCLSSLNYLEVHTSYGHKDPHYVLDCVVSVVCAVYTHTLVTGLTADLGIIHTSHWISVHGFEPVQ